MSKSNIEWTEQTWNPLTGCDKLSAGCKNCYAINMAWRLMHSPKKGVSEKYAGTVCKTEAGQLNWTGQVNLIPAELAKPLYENKPTIYFVNSMSDLFHEKVPVSFIADVFAIMWLTPQHTYQVLTKRSERMMKTFNDELFFTYLWASLQERTGKELTYQEVFRMMPLKNVWLGTSVEDQKQADIRIPYLLQTPAAIRFLSCEPLLGPVDLTKLNHNNNSFYQVLKPIVSSGDSNRPAIDWVIVGGESGHSSRAMHPDWVRSLRDQCKTGDVPFFFKQWGNWQAIDKPHEQNTIEKLLYNERWLNIAGGWGFHGEEVYRMRKVGKHAAGSLLDGKEHKEYPKSFVDAQTV